MTSRRQFLTTAAATAASLSFPSLNAQAAALPKNKLCGFTKHLQGLSYDQIADLAAEAGLDGIEAPIRPKGHIEPEAVADELPKLHEALKKRGLEISIMTSGINEVSKEQNTEQVLRTAKALGIQRYRMWFLKYDLKQPIAPQVENWKAQIKDLVALSSEIGIQPLIQNHSGKDYFGGPIWDAYSIVKDYKPEQIGFAFDSMHSTVEGGMSWPLEMNLAYDYVGAFYFKDFKWENKKAETCPLGEGQVSPDFAKAIVKRGFSGVISLHTEYMKGDTKDPAFVKASLEAFKRDIGVLKGWMA